MRKLDLRNYTVKEKIMNPAPGGRADVELPFFVKDSILNILFLPDLRLMGAELVRQNILAMKIEACQDEVLLEEEEYGRVLNAANLYPARCRADAILIDRILNQTPELEG